MSSLGQTYFWVVSGNGLQTSLCYNSSVLKEAHETIVITFYDCDGAIINKAEIEFPVNRNCITELEYYLELMKLESGIKHGIAQVETSSEGRFTVRYQHGQAVSYSGLDSHISNLQPGLVPLNFIPGKRSLLAISNCDQNQSLVRARLVLGKRSPELSWTLEPLSSRIIDITRAFSSELEESPDSLTGRGYLRLSTAAISGLLVHSLVVSQETDREESVEIY
jgi:hypothetical protein